MKNADQLITAPMNNEEMSALVLISEHAARTTKEVGAIMAGHIFSGLIDPNSITRATLLNPKNTAMPAYRSLRTICDDIATKGNLNKEQITRILRVVVLNLKQTNVAVGNEIATVNLTVDEIFHDKSNVRLHSK